MVDSCQVIGLFIGRCACRNDVEIYQPLSLSKRKKE